MKFSFTSPGVFALLLMCFVTGLTAQQADPDQPSDAPDSPVSANSAIGPALIHTPLDLTQEYLYSLHELVGPTHWIGFAVHAARVGQRRRFV